MESSLSKEEFQSCFEAVLEIDLGANLQRLKVISLLRDIFAFQPSFLITKILPCISKHEIVLASNSLWEKYSNLDFETEKNLMWRMIF